MMSWVTYSSPAEASKALGLTGTVMGEREVRVELATRDPNAPPRAPKSEYYFTFRLLKQTGSKSNKLFPSSFILLFLQLASLVSPASPARPLPQQLVIASLLPATRIAFRSGELPQRLPRPRWSRSLDLLAILSRPASARTRPLFSMPRPLLPSTPLAASTAPCSTDPQSRSTSSSWFAASALLAGAASLAAERQSPKVVLHAPLVLLATQLQLPLAETSREGLTSRTFLHLPLRVRSERILKAAAASIVSP